MFRKIVSTISFSPALVSQLSFYARRIRKEQATRRIGLIFTALALVVQSFAVFSAPEPANAANSADLLYGGVSSVNQLLSNYDRNVNNYRDIMNYLGITRSEIAGMKNASKSPQYVINSKKNLYSVSLQSRISYANGERNYTVSKSGGGTRKIYSRPLAYWDTGSNKRTGSNYKGWVGYSKKMGTFAIMSGCGNVVTNKRPPTVPPKPAPQPTASCVALDVIKASDSQQRFKVNATVSTGAHIGKYTVKITNTSGATVKTITYTSGSSTITTGNVTLSPGTYKAQAIVTTSVGDKTSANCTESFTVPKPGIKIEKTVNDKELIDVAVNEEFTYTIKVTNSGQTTLNNALVSDTPPSPIKINSVSEGSVDSSGRWTYTIPELKAGASRSFTMKARATSSADPGSEIIKNTACVNVDSITGEPDDCDDASVKVPEKTIEMCDTISKKMVTVKKSESTDSRYSSNPDDCIEMKVCDTDSDTITVIRKSEFDDKKHTTNLAECDKLQVCEIKTGEIITISKNDFDKSKYSDNPNDCVPDIAKSKKAFNETQDKDATQSSANAGDTIRYTITVYNVGSVDATANFEEELGDVLEYATLTDKGGGAFDSKNKTLSWPAVTLKAGESQSRVFTVKLPDTIPSGAQGTSEQTSYDCIMSNSFGNSADINVNCPATKQVETVVTDLPKTGPTANMIFAGIVLAVVTYFYARSRQIGKEIKVIRRDINVGTI